MDSRLATLLQNGCVEGQGFSQNSNPSNHQGGLLGHRNCGWGTPDCWHGLFHVPVNPRVTADGYTAVVVITNTALETFEMSYGHVPEIDCQIGQEVKTGDIIMPKKATTARSMWATSSSPAHNRMPATTTAFTATIRNAPW